MAAQILEELSEEIEALGARLCADGAVIAGHMAELQSIDLIAQKQRWLSRLLLADCPRTAVAAIGVEELRSRFGAGPDQDAA
jgi:hypothetical protein